MHWIDQFFTKHPDLQLQGSRYSSFATRSSVKSVDGGLSILRPGDPCEYLPFVLSGDLKVHRSSENGREVVLYHLSDGEGCILSALGILNSGSFPAVATAAGDSRVLLVPADLIRELVDSHAGWRAYIFSLYHSRFTEVLELINDMLFHKIDIRIARFILRRSGGGTEIRISQQELADEIGSSREVVSRILRGFIDRKILSTGRNRIEIIDRDALEEISS